MSGETVQTLREGSNTVRIEMEKQQVLKLYIVDNQSLERIVGVAEVNGKTYVSDEQGLVEIPVESGGSAEEYLREVRVFGTGADGQRNTFIQTYTNLPSSTELPLGLMVTSYKDLVDVEPEFAVSPELFRDFAQEGVFYNVTAPAHGLRGIDFQNAPNPVNNPEGEHGYVYWIDADYVHGINPDEYGVLTREQQEHIKSVIEERILSKIRPEHRPQIYLAQPGEDLPLVDGATRLQPDYGYLYVMHDLSLIHI